MRQNHYVYTAAALTAALALDGSALGDTVDFGAGNLTVAATWRAQPTNIAQGDSTTFKLSLRATGSDGTTGISFGDSVFSFASGSPSSIPTTADLVLGATSRSAGSSMAAMLAPLQVTYLEAGAYTATIETSDAPISWNHDGVAQTGTYSLNIGTNINVGSALPTIESASVPLLIGAGQSFGFSALADAGLVGNVVYQWDFDYDGTFSADSGSQNPTFAYAAPGVHTGMLRVMSENGFTPFEFSVDVFGGAHAPLPMAVWGGLGLMVAFGVYRARFAPRGQGA